MRVPIGCADYMTLTGQDPRRIRRYNIVSEGELDVAAARLSGLLCRWPAYGRETLATLSLGLR